ncbi:MAG: histidine--tRNA ligase [Lentisphaerae bacterium]|nr:histidine--tRNA ligase [Lentisphaerota bacterium]
MASTPLSLSPPRGMRDFYPEAMRVRNAVFDAWRGAAARFGFEEYDACVVENLELLQRKAGEEIVDQIYAFRDKSGRNLALRPEMTPTLARLVAARRQALALPLKWHCIAQCFRYERATRGRKREHYQWNLDILGEPSVAAENEIVGAAVCALDALGLERSAYRVHVSSRALVGELLDRLEVPPAHHPAVFLALDKLGKLEEPKIRALLSDAGLDASAIARVFELLNVASLDDAEALLGRRTPAAARLAALFEDAEPAGYQEVLTFDIRVVRGLAYYTGIVFEGFDTARDFRAIFGGGRYDNLLADVGGTSLTGVGLGFGDVVIAELLAARGRMPAAAAERDTAVGFMDVAQRRAALRLAARLRAEGRSVDLALAPEKARSFFARAGKQGFREAVYLGPDDLRNGTARIKDLRNRTERPLALD